MSGTKASFLDKYLSFYQSAKEVVSLFNNQYAILPAYTAEQNAAAHRLRHQIYCSELGYEPGNDTQIERDVYDAISTQIVLHYKPLNASIGCVRFVHGVVNGVLQTLPMEETCGDSIDSEMLQKVKQSGHHYAEVSRLGIDRKFRSLGRTERGNVKSPIRSSCALLALLLGIHAFAKQTDTKYLLAIVEKKLWNTMVKLGIPVVAMGQPVSHRGKRYPILMDRDEIEKIIPLLMRPLYHAIERDMARLTEVYQDDRAAESGDAHHLVDRSLPAMQDVALPVEPLRPVLMA